MTVIINADSLLSYPKVVKLDKEFKEVNENHLYELLLDNPTVIGEPGFQVIRYDVLLPNILGLSLFHSNYIF